jgi:hypothetical protein
MTPAHQYQLGSAAGIRPHDIEVWARRSYDLKKPRPFEACGHAPISL